MKLLLIIMALVFAPVIVALGLLIVTLMFSAWLVGFPFHVTKTRGDTKYVTVYRWFTPISKYTEPK